MKISVFAIGPWSCGSADIQTNRIAATQAAALPSSAR
jgi:hypothetical protein